MNYGDATEIINPPTGDYSHTGLKSIRNVAEMEKCKFQTIFIEDQAEDDLSW